MPVIRTAQVELGSEAAAAVTESQARRCPPKGLSGWRLAQSESLIRDSISRGSLTVTGNAVAAGFRVKKSMLSS